jgi:hypothetical protein
MINKVFELETGNPVLISENEDGVFIVGEILTIDGNMFGIKTGTGIYKRDLKDIKKATQIELIEQKKKKMQSFRTRNTKDETIDLLTAINKQAQISMEIRRLEMKKQTLGVEINGRF